MADEGAFLFSLSLRFTGRCGVRNLIVSTCKCNRSHIIILYGTYGQLAPCHITPEGFILTPKFLALIPRLPRSVT
jgi:hypothetical protein